MPGSLADATKGNAVRRILVFRGGAVGDVILTLPAVGALRLAFPNAQIKVAGDPERLCLALHPGYADAIVDAEALQIHRLFGRRVDASQKLLSCLQECDLILSYAPAANPVFIDNVRRYCSGEVITWPPHPGDAVHAADHLLQPVLRFLDTVPRGEPRVYPGTEHRRAADRFWQSAGLPQQGVLAIHPGSGGLHKLWPREGWQQVLGWAAKCGVPGILIRGPAELERGPGRMPDGLGPGWKTLSRAPLLEVAAILEKCAVFAGHDSGVTHLAAAVGTPTLALFGPTDPRVWGPRGCRACVLQPAVPAPLGLANMPAGAVTDTLRAMLDGTFPFDPCESGHTRRRVPPTAG